MTIPNWRVKLKYYRKNKNVTQAELAGFLNTTQQTIVNWEKEGGTNPSIDELYIITKFLGITLNDLFEESTKNVQVNTTKNQDYTINEKIDNIENDIDLIKKHLNLK